jgi:predicted dehydrogenase
MTSTVIKQRPIQQMGKGTHFDVIEGGELGDVENEDYAGMMIRFAENAVGAGAVGTLEASRVSVGPRASYNFEIYGTEGSLRWDFERMNELEVAVGRKGEFVGYTRVLASPGFGDFDHFQPGAGTGMGFDDLKVIEARKFLEAFVGKQHLNSNINDAVSAAAVCEAVERSAESGQWVTLAPVAGVTAATR